MNTRENNKLIAEFMGLETQRMDTDGYHVLYENPITGDYEGEGHLDYDESWDWLMPVVKKIEQTVEGVPPQLLHLSLFSEHREIYNAVVEFIEWYNENK
jgi:hypothetical protein